MSKRMVYMVDLDSSSTARYAIAPREADSKTYLCNNIFG
jgi:hypothetical protein